MLSNSENPIRLEWFLEKNSINAKNKSHLLLFDWLKI